MSTIHARVKGFVHTKNFCHFVNYAIVAFAVFIGIETFLLGDRSYERIFSVIETLFLIFFTAEIILRIYAEDHPADFFNIFKRRKLLVQGRKKTEYEII